MTAFHCSEKQGAYFCRKVDIKRHGAETISDGAEGAIGWKLGHKYGEDGAREKKIAKKMYGAEGAILGEDGL